MERLSGTDALLWQLQRPDTPLHTLKVMVLDTSRRGRPVTLAELRGVAESRLGLIPRATQKVAWAPGFGARPFWVDDPSFCLNDHLDERVARAEPDALDRVCSDLATEPLPPDRPLWSATLVHGLPDDRQAIVARVHHAVADGIAALNTFLALSTDEAGVGVRVAPWSGGAVRSISMGELRRAVLREVPGLVGGLVPLAVDAVKSRRAAAEYRAEVPELPHFIAAERRFCNASSGARRVCATIGLPLADFKVIGRESGATINGVYHAVLAGALRQELLRHGEPIDEQAVAAFGIAEDPNDRARISGNRITPTTVALRVDLDDPWERLLSTARSCLQGVELRRRTGLEMAGRWGLYGPRVASLFRRLMADRWPRVVSHVTTANVRGPSSTRWFGDVEVADWFSFAVAVNPSNLNITAYSYDGRMNLGLVTTPEVLPDPHGFLARVGDALAELVQVSTAKDGASGLLSRA